MRCRRRRMIKLLLIALLGGHILVLGAKLGNDKPRASSVSGRAQSRKRAGAPTDPVKELMKQEAVLLEQMDRKEEEYLKQYLKPPNSLGVRAPISRNVRVFFPVSSRPASSAATEEDEPKADTSAILSAHSERSKRLLLSSSFTSTNSREIARRRRTTVFPYILLRVRFPDGMLVQARFGLNETVRDVLEVVGESLAPEYAGASFSLLSLGGTRRMLFRRNGDKEATLRLSDCGLAPPAATLMLRWDGPTPETVKAWVSPRTENEEGEGEKDSDRDRDSCSEGEWPCAWAVVVREDLALAAKDRHAQAALPDDVPLGFRHSGGEDEHKASRAAALESKLTKHFGL